MEHPSLAPVGLKKDLVNGGKGVKQARKVQAKVAKAKEDDFTDMGPTSRRRHLHHGLRGKGTKRV